MGLIHIVKTRFMNDPTRLAIDTALPVTLAFSPRRLTYHAQIRTEVKLASGAIAAAMSDLRSADTNGLLDILWLDRCPLFDSVRSFPEFRLIRESTGARAARIVRILDP